MGLICHMWQVGYFAMQTEATIQEFCSCSNDLRDQLMNLKIMDNNHKLGTRCLCGFHCLF